MLIFDQKIPNLVVASVQAGQPIGNVTGYIIDPMRLHVVALYVSTSQATDLILHTSDIRDFHLSGVLIDHDNQLMEREGLVRLEQVINLNFTLVGKSVETEDGGKLGKVASFVLDSNTWLIMKLHLGQNPVKSIKTTELIVTRQQIVKVTDDKVVVKSTAIKSGGGFSLKKLLFGSPKTVLNPETTTTSSRER